MNDGPGWRFADPETVAALTNGERIGSNQWVGHCPCCNDEKMRLSIRWGRKQGVVVKCHAPAACDQKRLLAWFGRQGLRLDPVLPEMKPKPSRRLHRGLMVEDSISFAVLTLSERRMFDMLKGGESPTYNAFVRAGVRRQAIPQGLRAMEALGLIEVERRPFDARRGRYDSNVYRLSERWTDFQPRLTPPKMRATARRQALDRAKEVARAARRKPRGGAKAESEAPHMTH